MIASAGTATRQNSAIADLGSDCPSPANGLPAVCLVNFPPYTPLSASIVANSLSFNVSTTASAATRTRHSGVTTDPEADCPSPSYGLPTVCLAVFPPYTSSLASTTAYTFSLNTITTTAVPTVSYYQQDEDPDRGINQQGCICHQGSTTKTLPSFRPADQTALAALIPTSLRMPSP